MIRKIATSAFRPILKIINPKPKSPTMEQIHPSNHPLLTITIAFPFVNIPISSKYHQIQLPTSLDPALRMAQSEPKLNQKILLLQHITELILKDPKLGGRRVESFMVRELKKWEGETGGRFQKVATVAWVIRKLGLRKYLGDLYGEIARRVDEDQWYVDFDQSVKAIEAFSDFKETQLRNRIFQKIERNLTITLSDVNMTYYQRICSSLFQAQRHRSPLWDKLEHFITRNLSMQYSARTFFDIFKYFAITHNGTSEFYEICQQVIHRGHLYSSTFRLRNNTSDYDASGDYLALIMATYAEINRYADFPLSGDFLDYLYKNLRASKMEFRDIGALTKVVKGMSVLGFHESQVEQVVEDIVRNKEFSEYGSLIDIQALYFAMEEKYGRVPDKLRANVQSLVVKDLNRNLLPLQTAIETVSFLLSYHKEEKEGEEQGKEQSSLLIDSLNNSIERRFKYLEHEEKQIVIETLKGFKQAKQIQQKVQPQKPKALPQTNH